MKFSLTLLLLVGVAFALNVPVNEDRVLVQSARDCDFSGTGCDDHDWIIHPNQKSMDTMVKLVFVLKQQNADTCDTLLTDISSPKSSNFGKMYSFEDIGKIFRNERAVAKTKWWLASQGVKIEHMNITPNGELISFSSCQPLAEKILGTKFTKFYSKVLFEEIIRAPSYTLPSFLLDHVSFVGNVVTFPKTLLRTSVRVSEGVTALGQTTPDLINSVYNIDDNTCTADGNSYALFESLGQQYSPDDLASFQTKFNLPSDEVDNQVGTNKPLLCTVSVNSCAEANLDVQYMLAVAQGADSTYWSVANGNDPFLDWIEALAADENPPYVHSMSYGAIEIAEPDKGVEQFNLEACKLGLRRVTILIASGDDGVANFQARSDKTKCGFSPSYPASCPYVTAVGATQGPEDNKDEVACSADTNGGITTGGGFSTVFDAPDYQKDAISNYFSVAENLPPTSDFASTGRGYPDVAAMGHNYPIYDGGRELAVSGTSASAPVFAGIVTLINDARLNAGKNPIGFLNPSLYSEEFADVFNDITSGNNRCCAQSFRQVCCDEGFYTAKGWDPVTGLGTVDFEKFKAAALALP